MAGISRCTSIRANGKAPSIAERARRRDGMALVSDQKTLARPAPVTLSAGLIILGSVSVIALAFAGIAELRSIETREAVEASLKEWPLKSLDLTLDSALSLIRAASMIAGACAAAAAVLGIFLFRRNRAARLGLSVLAIPLLVTGLATGGFMATLVAVSTVTLWLQPARDWFDGIAPAAGAANRERTERKKSPAAAGSPEWPPPASTEVIIPRKPVVSDSDARPKSVTVACVTSWVGTGFTLLFVALSLAVLSADPERVLVEVEKQQPEAISQGLTGDALISASFVVGGIVIGWCLLAILFATLAYRRSRWARIALLFSAAAATVLTAIGSIGAVFLLPLLMACVMTISLLMRPEVRTWYATA